MGEIIRDDGNGEGAPRRWTEIQGEQTKDTNDKSDLPWWWSGSPAAAEKINNLAEEVKALLPAIVGEPFENRLAAHLRQIWTLIGACDLVLVLHEIQEMAQEDLWLDEVIEELTKGGGFTERQHEDLSEKMADLSMVIDQEIVTRLAEDCSCTVRK